MRGFCPLASGSKGNAVYVGTGTKKVLIDAGISCKALTERLQEIGVSIAEVDAVFVTHEHTDHIAGLSQLVARYHIPIFANLLTARQISKTLKKEGNFTFFTTGEAFSYGDMEIHPFSIPHDTVDPVGFTITTPTYRLGVCTDLGFVTPTVVQHLQNCCYLYLEANHNQELVHLSKRPDIYKQRVLGPVGHLSNTACGHLLRALHHQGLKHVHLAHLSSECNTAERAIAEVRQELSDAQAQLAISVAEQVRISKPIPC